MPPVKEQFQELDPRLPVALFPLRLQVRFATPRMVAGLEEGDMREDLTGEDPVELWVRIYPDDIFVHSHEENLSEDEYEAATDYWDALWQSVSSNDPDAERRRIREGARQALVDAFGPVRARYVLIRTEPPGLDAEGFPSGPPQLPDLDLSPESWNEAARTYLLPDRFVLRLERGDQQWEIPGHPIQKQDQALQLGLDPQQEDAFADTPGGRQVPEAIRWMTDFSKAVEIGMGVRIPLEGDDLQGFDRLYVLGWLNLSDTGASIPLLESLFENHRYKVGGMDLVAPGTPTNNTREATVSPGPDEPSIIESVASGENGSTEDEPQPAPGDAERLSRALGLPASTFAELEHSDQQAVQQGADIHRLLAETTLGQALDFWYGDLEDTRRQAVLDYMAQWVSGRGLLPAIRIDDQPYSFLPVFPFSRLDDHLHWLGDAFYQDLWKNILRPIQQWYDRQVGDLLYLEEPAEGQRPCRIPHMHKNLQVDQVQTTFLSILQQHPVSVSYRQRFGLGPDFFSTDPDDLPEALQPFAGKEKKDESLEAIRSGLDEVGFPRPDGLALDQLYWDTETYALADPDQDELLGSEGDALLPLKDSDQNYLEWLAGADLSAIENDSGQWEGAFRPLLYRLLRHRLLQSNDDPEVRSAIQGLARLPLSVLRLLIQEHLDCCTYRLDAWIGGLAARRLEHIRNQKPQGIHIGAWGYLENLRPNRDPLRRGEYIPAPSLRHATTAAILRSGFQANRFSSGSEANGLFAVNLNSIRVKDALFLLEGVQNGQDLAALLGYRLERQMQEYLSGDVPVLARFILDLRKSYPFKVEPLIVGENSSSAEITEDTSQRVINALDLIQDREDWESELDAPPTVAQLQSFWAERLDDTPDDDQVSGLEDLLSRLDNDLDAVKDLLAAEGVYQLVDGQVDRAKAALDAMTEGDQVFRPELADIPRSSIPLTFRMGVILPDKPLTTIGGAPLSARALASPKINRWLYDKLPGMSIIRVNVRWESEPDAAGQTSVETDHLLLRELFIQPVDLVYMMHLQRENPETSELRYRIESAIRKRHDLPLTQRIEILEKDRTGFRNFEYTLFAVEPLAAALGKLLLEARYLKPEDFLQPNSEARDQAGQYWVPASLRGGLRNVALQMEDHAQTFAANLANVRSRLASGDELDATRIRRDIQAMRSGMFFYAGLGWVHAVPTQVEAINRLALEEHYRRAEAIYRDAENRLKQAADLLEEDSGQSLSQLLQSLPEGDPQLATETLEAIAKLLFGRFFRVFPEFNLPNAAEVAEALASDELQASQAGFAVDRWVQTQAPVRPRMDLYQRTAMLSDLFGRSGELKGYDLIQLPIREGSTGPWVGWEYGDFVPHSDTLAMTLELQKDFDLGHRTFSGILVDEWNELVPDPTANTGIALQYDQPDMEAPNAVLLAMTPADEIAWDWDMLVDSVKDALRTAKQRAVDPDLLKESFWDQLLPGLMGPVFSDNERDTLLYGRRPSEVVGVEPARREAARGIAESTRDLGDFGLGDLDLGNLLSRED